MNSSKSVWGLQERPSNFGSHHDNQTSKCLDLNSGFISVCEIQYFVDPSRDSLHDHTRTHKHTHTKKNVNNILKTDILVTIFEKKYETPLNFALRLSEEGQHPWTLLYFSH